MLTSRVSVLGAFAALAALAVTARKLGDDVYDSQAQAIVDGFDVAQVLGQMTQINIDQVLNSDKSLNEDSVRTYAKMNVGSYLNSPWSGVLEDTTKWGWNATEWRKVVTRIQEITMEENGGHPMVYGLDSVHGAIYVSGAVIFGQEINAGASFNPDLVYEMGRITGRDTEAAGIPWVFGPILDLSQNPLWARTYETFGEDPYLCSVLGDAIIRGLQSNNQTAACMKHFVGYSKTPTGHDRDGVTMSDFDLLNYFVEPYQAGIAAGALSSMENYISINGIPVVASSKILEDLVRNDLNYDGVVVTDWAEINNLKDWHRVVDTYDEAVRLSLTRTALDMSMVPYDTEFITYATEMLNSFPEYETRLRESAKRIIKMKLKLGLYENPVPGADNEFLVGNDDDKAVALDLARESIVLLKNDGNILPLANGSSVFLTGHSADNIGYQCGGWSVAWQGYSGNEMFPNGISVREGLENVVGNDSFTYFNGLNVDGTYTSEDLATAVELAGQHEYTIAVIGEHTYAEKAGDIDDLDLPSGQIAYVQALAATGTKVILVLFEGRPRLLGTLPDTATAVVHGLLACELGGQAMAEIIYGEVNPSGKLPLTYPKDSANVMIPYNHRVTTKCVDDNGAYVDCEMQWDFGAGLSYTTFTYSAVTLSKTTVTGPDDSLTASVFVTNSGSVTGKETVMLFVIQPYRLISVPEVKILRKFEKIELAPGITQEVTFTLTVDDWSVYDPQIGSGFNQVAEDGTFVVAIKPDTDCDVYNTIINNLCASFTLNTGAVNFGLNVEGVHKFRFAGSIATAATLTVANADEYDAKAQSIVDGFSIDQVIGEMTQIDISTVLYPEDNTLNEDQVRAYAQQYVGSYLNTIWDEPLGDKYGWNATEWRAIVSRIQEITMEENNGHPILYGLDSVHGANYVTGAIIFPQQINGGASFNPDLAYEMGRITARDTLAGGIPWIFGPILDISQNPLWSRTYETFGEDPYMAAVFGEAVIRGLQSSNRTAACMKHFVGYSKTPTGHDRDGVVMSDFDLLNYFVPPFKAAIDAGVMTAMENYISINGVPVVASSKILNDLLRSDLGFDGLVVSDWAEINNLKDWHRVVETYEEAVRLSLTHTSLDMSMVPNDTAFIDYAQNMVDSYPHYQSRLRESAKRIVKLKLQLGLYENPVPGEEYEFMVGNDDDKAAALNMARESIVLLENNESTLPLPKDASVFLTGHSADNVGHQCGGWTVAWQGYSGNEMFPNGITVRQGLETMVGNNSFTYFNGLYDNGTYSEADLATAVQHASQHEYTIAVIGEKQYTEKPGDIDDLALPQGQIDYVEALAATGTKVIIVLFEGRPRLLGSLPDKVSAIVHGLLPCEVGGQAMAEILYGEVNPSGKLPITYPKDSGNIAIPYNHRVTTQCAYGDCSMQWDFGAGLSYTEFNYSAVALSKTTVSGPEDSVTATVTVTNTGTRAGKEAVMLFLTQPFRLISVPEVKMLKKFTKIDLQPGEVREVSFTLTADDWSVYDPQIGSGFKQVAEDGKFVVAIKPDTWCDVYHNITNPLCSVFTLDTGSDKFGLPEVDIPATNLTSTVLPATQTGAGTVDAANF
ncbi:hypothetical protein BBO99_00000862 [Phytophthora kernoviae]|uniref:beta-glucosidase n=2 Tax=Phytophthora kernoviae TaxID=325452 RepID=A0A3R7HNC7_9STRA|nr:hypothetical protein G195_001546 [Phytophthora kernoviae 00238/432]KAG2531798.1 hypothetical protein JM16_000687 [Phytophthora kernoviae]KAG2532722.1 hypothetical protein JM18_000769 [Phytophthora kernoviae]RLN44387.1 hypothetical protein BBI17_000958 [Phytophthora kernoviae]RLN85016.1 hypothetical protein BBO99_00000862 [Phytophthora kernoviae]